MAGKTVLCISDEESLLDSRKRKLESSGFKVLTASNGKNALATLASHSVDAVVLDCAILDGDCGALPAPIKQAKPRVPVILLSAKPPATQVAVAAVDVFISKQENDHQLLNAGLQNPGTQAYQYDFRPAQHERSTRPWEGFDRRLEF
jgi:DNA-binding response OmpR family regulator